MNAASSKRRHLDILEVLGKDYKLRSSICVAKGSARELGNAMRPAIASASRNALPADNKLHITRH